MTARIDVLDATALAPTPSNLDQLVAQGVEGVDGLMKVPGKRGDDIVIPGAHGQLHVPNKMFDAGNVVLPLWVRGVNPDGTLPGGDDPDDPTRLAFHARARALCDLFAPDLITVRHTLSDGTARQVTGEPTDPLDWTVKGAGRHTLGLVTIGLKCADPFWSDIDPVTQTLTLTSGQTGQLTAFAGASAPMENLLVAFGQSSNPRVDQPSTGIFAQVGKVIAAGQITVDTERWQVYGSGGAPTTGLFEALSYGGRGTSRWFALMPEPGGPTVRFTHTGGGARQVSFTGRRRYRIA